ELGRWLAAPSDLPFIRSESPPDRTRPSRLRTSRPSLIDRGIRWCQRNPRLIWMQGAIGAALIAVCGLVWMAAKPSARRLPNKTAMPVPPLRDMVFTGHDARVSAVMFAPDGRTLLTGGDSGQSGSKGKLEGIVPGSDNTVRFWDLHTGQQTGIIKERLGQI